MGLTIHYQLKLADAHDGMDDFQSRWAVEETRKLALKFKRRGRVESVGPMSFAPSARPYASEWRTRRVRGCPNTFTGEEIRPLAGHLFQVGVGSDCEPLWLGLCRYDKRGWRLRGFCKTQYAGLHGWEHFQRCHTAVIDLLAGARQLGFVVAINDEGGYWPGRNLAVLRESLDEMNAAVAAAAGALKDCAGDDAATPVRSPIFAHRQFERLEAEGAARGIASRLRKVARTLNET